MHLPFFQPKNKYTGNDFIEKHIFFDGVDIEMNIHRADSRQVIIMYPGAEGSIDGYNQKYLKIANWIVSMNIASVIRLDNKYCCVKMPYVETMVAKLAHVIEYVYKNSIELVDQEQIDLCLAGVSAGASAISMILEEFTDIKKVLLIAPSDSLGIDNMKRGLADYRGELYLLAGSDDEIGAVATAKACYDVSEKTSMKRVEVATDCDHQFTGKKNGLILSSAYLWAFDNEKKELKNKKGIVLYR